MATNEVTKVDDYVLKRSRAASARLNFQHSVWLDDFGRRLLHESIPLVAKKKLLIADIGTGTGIWLLDFARQYPEIAQLEGLDISLDQAPPAGFLPPNVSFRKYDVHEEPPSDLVQRYDIIHTRHLQTVVKQNDPSQILANILKMLKPGGYIQWGEFDLTNRKAITAAPGGSTANLIALLDRITELFPAFKSSWIGELGESFKTAQLYDVQLQRVLPPASHAYLQMDLAMLAYEEFVDGYARMQKATPEEIEDLRSRVVKTGAEIRQGAAWIIPRLVAVGRKPS